MLFNYFHCSWIQPRSAWITPANAIQNMVPSEFDHQDSIDRDRSRSPRRNGLGGSSPTMTDEHQGDSIRTGLNTPTSQMSEWSSGPDWWLESPGRTPNGHSPRSLSPLSIRSDVGQMVPITPPTPPGGFDVGQMVPVTPPLPPGGFPDAPQPWFVPRTPPELLMMTRSPGTPESQ